MEGREESGWRVCSVLYYRCYHPNHYFIIVTTTTSTAAATTSVTYFFSISHALHSPWWWWWWTEWVMSTILVEKYPKAVLNGGG
jgi:hypothetical protein